MRRRALRGSGVVAQIPARASSWDVLHDHAELPLDLGELVDLHEVRVVETRRDARLIQEHVHVALIVAVVRQDPLDHDPLFESGGPFHTPEKHLGHAANSQATVQEVPSEPGRHRAKTLSSFANRRHPWRPQLELRYSFSVQRRLSRWLVGILLVVWAPQALAANRALRRAKRAYEQLEYDNVTPLLKKALEASSEPSEEVEIYALLATMHVMYGRDAQAEEAFVHVLERQPDFELPSDSSPKLFAALEAAEQQFAKPAPEDGASDGSVAETGGEVGEGDRGDPDGDQAGDGHDGGEVDPITNPMLPGPITEPTRFYSTWWFWTAVGVVVAGAAGTTAYFITQPRFPETEFGPYNL
jgi:hypothetical protein